MTAASTATARPQLISKAEICKMIGCHSRALDRWIKLGTFPLPIRFSARMLRWTMADVEALIERRRMSA
jgi:predicted DNA-binding transcriptional regulator AlpA